MRKFKLDLYKDFQQYFNLLDVLIKNESSNKELFLEDIDISPSSYRRAKNEGNKIGEIILQKLARHFNYNLCDECIIDQIEDKINEIYYAIYYKDYKRYDEYFDWLDDMLSKRYIIYPIFTLFKLLMILNSKKSPRNILNGLNDLYFEIKSYESFYEEELIEIVEILDVTFKKDIDNYFLSKTYKNELTYHTLATRCNLSGRYLESIYFCKLAKEKFITDENYKRIYYINLTLISNYNFLLMFHEADLLVQKQLLNLNSINDVGDEYEFTKSLYIITCLGLKKYDEVINSLEKKEGLTLTQIVCLLISYYFYDKNNYYITYNELISEEESENIILCLKYLNEILKSNNKKKVQELERYDINKTVLEILKKM